MTEQILYRCIISRVFTISEDLREKYKKPLFMNDPVQIRIEAEMRSNDRHSKIMPKHIVKVFDITIDKAKDTLSKTTQMTIRQGVNPITLRLSI